MKAQIPSATFVNYETFKISQMSIDGGEEKSEDGAKQEEGANGRGEN